MAATILSTRDPDSTAVIVLFDQELVERIRAELPGTHVVQFWHPDVPRHDVYVPAQLGRMFREAWSATREHPEVWVIGRRSGSSGRRRAARFADQAALSQRRRVLRDSVETSLGVLEFARWVDLPGGIATRREIAQSRAWADSVLAVGLPNRVPITIPFTPEDLRIDRDTLSHYLSMLPDTSLYSIGGCSDVQTTSWTASESLGRMGPAVVPVLVDRMNDPDPFVRDRVQEALLYATQDERILARTAGEYLKFYDQPGIPAAEVVASWWTRFGRFWASPDSVRSEQR